MRRVGERQVVLFPPDNPWGLRTPLLPPPIRKLPIGSQSVGIIGPFFEGGAVVEVGGEREEFEGGGVIGYWGMAGGKI